MKYTHITIKQRGKIIKYFKSAAKPSPFLACVAIKFFKFF